MVSSSMIDDILAARQKDYFDLLSADTPAYTLPKPPFRLLGDLRLGQAILNALTQAGHLKQASMLTVDGTRADYRVTGKDLYYMEDAELIKLVRDYIVKLERQDVKRKAAQDKPPYICHCINGTPHEVPSMQQVVRNKSDGSLSL